MAYIKELKSEAAELDKLLNRPRGQARKGVRTGRVKSDYGPAMSELTPLKQRFVELYVQSPTLANTKLLKMAGYEGTDVSLAKASWRVMREPLVLEAIRECAAVRMKQIVPKAVKALDEVIQDKTHRDHVRASLALLDRTGLHAVHESKQTITHSFDRSTAIARIASILEKNPAAFSALRMLNPPTVEVVIEEPVGEEPVVVRKEVKKIDQ